MVLNLFKFLQPKAPSYRTSTITNQTRANITAEWNNINILVKGNQPSQLKQALISADKTLDNALRDMVAGETMGERLKNAKDKFSRDVYNNIWEAHKMRNNLVHESGYEPPYYTVIRNVNNIKQALNSLGLKI